MVLLDLLFRWPAVDEVFAARTTIQRMLDFEAALARAEAHAGLIPESAVEAIVSQCRADLFEIQGISEAAAPAGNTAIPLIKELTGKVAAISDEAAGYVHWGATSQDLIDTAAVLQLRDALALIQSELLRLHEVLCGLALQYRDTPMAGRTWMQHGVPIVLGLKFAGWADAFTRHSTRLSRVRQEIQVLQFGGAAGTLASLGDKGLAVANGMAHHLDLELPAMPWHAHRDRFAEVATTLGLLAATLGKIARDLSLLSQTEVGEISEPSGAGRGGSSTMPQKRNPVTAAVVLAAATRVPGLVSTILTAMLQEHERGVGGWHAEWETLPEIVQLTAGALHHLCNTAAGFEISTGRIHENLDATRGLIFAEAVTMSLARFVGKSKAHAIIEACVIEGVRRGEHLRAVLARHRTIAEHLTPADIDKLFDPLSYLGSSGAFIDRVASSKVR